MTLPTGTLAPAMPQTFLTTAGAPAVGYKLFVYVAGTQDHATTYTNANLSAQNTNPIVLDSAGSATIFLAQGGCYDFVLAPANDTDPPTSAEWTRSSVYSVPFDSGAQDVSGTAGATVTLNDIVYLSDGTDSKTAGRWYRAKADYAYSSSRAPALGVMQTVNGAGAGDAITVRTYGVCQNFASLNPGTTYYVDANTAGQYTSTPPANAAPIGTAITSTDFYLSQWTVAADWHTYGDNGENLVKDSAFQIFAAGDAATGTHWTLSGGTAARVAGSIGANALQITPGGTNRLVTQTILPSSLFPTYFRSKTVAITVWGTAAAALAFQAYADDGVTTGSGLPNTTTGFEAVTYVHQLSGTATKLAVGVNITTNSIPKIHGIRVKFGSYPAMFYKPSLTERRSIIFTISGGQTTGTTKGGFIWYAPFPLLVLETILQLGTACAGSSFIVDVNKNGTTMYSTRPTIADGGTQGTAAPDSATYSTRCLTRGDRITFDIDQVGSGTAGSDLTVEVVYRYFPNSFDEYCAVTDLA